MEWAVVLPVKALATAKSRLVDVPGVDRRALALAMAEDVSRAARATAGVSALIVVTSDAEVAAVLAATGVRVVDQGRVAGLDAAVVVGATAAQHEDGGLGVAALVADLPALTANDLAAGLAQAAGHGRAFVADRSGTGTTLLTAGPGAELAPAFGPGSAARHAGSGAVPLQGDLRSLRLDVDTAEDLAAAGALGLGPATATALRVAARSSAGG